MRVVESQRLPEGSGRRGSSPTGISSVMVNPPVTPTVGLGFVTAMATSMGWPTMAVSPRLPVGLVPLGVVTVFLTRKPPITTEALSLLLVVIQSPRAP